jgi:hypothetical protein
MSLVFNDNQYNIHLHINDLFFWLKLPLTRLFFFSDQTKPDYYIWYVLSWLLLLGR